MIDIFALSLAHGLLALAAWRLMQRDDLDSDPAGPDDAEGADTRPPQDAATRRNAGRDNARRVPRA